MRSVECRSVALIVSQETFAHYGLVGQANCQSMAEVLRGAFARFFDSPEVGTPLVSTDKAEAAAYIASEERAEAHTAWYRRLEAIEPSLTIDSGYKRGSRLQTQLTLPVLHASGLDILQTARARRQHPGLADLRQLIQENPDLGEFIDKQKIMCNRKTDNYEITEAVLDRDLSIMAADPDFLKKMKEALQYRRSVYPPQYQSKPRPWEM